MFDYTGKVFLSIKDYEDKFVKEIASVRNLKKECLPWFIEGGRKKGKSTSCIKHMREPKARELAGIGIETVEHFLETENCILMSEEICDAAKLFEEGCFFISSLHSSVPNRPKYGFSCFW